MKKAIIFRYSTFFRSIQRYSFVALIFMMACSPTRHLEKDQKLLTKVKVNIDKDPSFTSELKSIAKQKPNRRLLGLFRIYLGIYNIYYHKTDSKIKDNIGEAPVVYDSTLNEISADLMNKYLNNRGFYRNQVETEAALKKKKAKLSFNVKAGERFSIQQVKYEIKDKEIKNILQLDSNNAILKVNIPFDLEYLKEERVRIERLMKNNGFYEFSREYILFKVDTFHHSHSANIKVSIKNPTTTYLNTDSIVELSHKRFTVSKVYVRMDYTTQNINQLTGDTSMIDSMHFIELKGEKFNKKAISRITYIRPGNLYNLSIQEQTYRNLSALRVFSYVSIQYEKDYDLGEGFLIAYIDLNPRKQRSLTLETEGTNNGGNLGLNSTVTFQNNNTFKGAEILNISLNGGIEAQQLLTENNDNQIIDGILPFNTVEFGPEVNLEVPRFLLPGNADRYSPRGNPRTTFNLSYNFQQRPDYKRNVTKTYIAYSWNESPTKTHIVQPFDFSYINLDPSTSFSNFLQSQNSFVKNSYTDNLILALKYSFIYNNKTSNTLKNNIFFRVNFESAGNLLALTTNGFNNQVDTVVTITENGSDNSLDTSFNNVYRILDIQYAQYLRTNIDFRYYQKFNYNQLVYRFATGIGIPYGNSVAMPFEKSFYAGGANGIRAWRARELGPGNLSDSASQNIDQIGNMDLQANVEFRFQITELIEGAAFIDAGNIWNFNQDDSPSETQFKLRNLWKGTAMGIGTGLRLNFNFFILRLDVATRIKDPALKNPDVIRPQWDLTNLNLGIGYPF